MIAFNIIRYKKVFIQYRFTHYYYPKRTAETRNFLSYNTNMAMVIKSQIKHNQNEDLSVRKSEIF